MGSNTGVTWRQDIAALVAKEARALAARHPELGPSTVKIARCEVRQRMFDETNAILAQLYCTPNPGAVSDLEMGIWEPEGMEEYDRDEEIETDEEA